MSTHSRVLLAHPHPRHYSFHPRCSVRITPRASHTPNHTTLGTIPNHLIHVSLSDHSTTTLQHRKNLQQHSWPLIASLLIDSHTLSGAQWRTFPPVVWHHTLATKQLHSSCMFGLVSFAATETLGILLSVSLAAASERKIRRKRLCGLSHCQGLPPQATVLIDFSYFFHLTFVFHMLFVGFRYSSPSFCFICACFFF